MLVADKSDFREGKLVLLRGGTVFAVLNLDKVEAVVMEHLHIESEQVRESK